MSIVELPSPCAEEPTTNSKSEPLIEPDVVLAFSEQSIRRAFARKVFAILTLLLVKTTVYVCACTFVPVLRDFWAKNIIYVSIGFGPYIVSYIIIICVKSARRTFPINYILLFTFSTSVTYMLGGICSNERGETVLLALGITTVVCLSLIIFACQTKWDFTGCGMFLWSLVLILLLSSILSLVWMNRAVQIWITAAGLVVFCIILIYDVQLIISGNHSYKISPEEHIFAVIVLYLDIIIIFTKILKLLR